MNAVALVSAILFGAISPIAADLPEGVKAAEVLLVEDEVVAAVVPDGIASYEEKDKLLQEVADRLAEEEGKSVILTQDFLTYLILLRMEKRGINAYERENLASRILRLKDTCYFADPPAKEAA